MTQPRERKKKGQRPDGLIQVTATVGFDSNGKRIRASFYGHTRAEANEQREEYKRLTELGISIADRDTTLSQWIDIWKQKYKDNLGISNNANYESQIKRLKKALGHMPIWDIREAHLKDALKAVRGMSSSTINKYLMVIRQIFLRAKSNKIILDNPAENIDASDLNATEHSHRALERWETDRILQNWNQHRAGLWAMLMLLCGLRRGEMMALEWSAIDMQKRKLSITQSIELKGNKPIVKDTAKSIAGKRTLPICEPLFLALSATPQEQRSGFVCLSANHKPLTQSAYDRGWEGFCAAMRHLLNGEPVSLQGKRDDVDEKIAAAKEKNEKYIDFDILAHDLRHTYATALYDAGVPVKAAQYYLGHADIRMTLDLYTHLSKERENQSRALMIDYLDSWFKKEYNPSEKSTDENLNF